MSDEQQQAPIDPRDIERTRQQIRQLVAEINQLASSDVPPQKFYGEFLQRVVTAVAAVGGAIWVRDGQNPPRLQHQVNFRPSGLLDEAPGPGGHGSLLMHMFSNGQSKLVPPHTMGADKQAGGNSSDLSLILAPLKIDKHTVGVAEVLLDPSRRQTAQQNAVKFVAELCEMGAGYLKNRQLQHMLGQQHLWTQLESFVKQIHSSLSVKEVAYIVSNEGKRLVACDRLSVAIVYGRKTVIEAVSGQEVVERKSTLVQLMRRLCDTVIRSNENLLYIGEEIEGLPPAVRDALDDYLAESGSKVSDITLLRTTNKEGHPNPPFGALLGEQFEDVTIAEQISPRMDVVAQHATTALSNALAHHRIFMLPIWSAIGNSLEWMRGDRLIKLSVVIAGVAVLVASMVFIPLELRLEGRGELLPENTKKVFATEDNATITRVLIEHGQNVRQDQPLLEMRSPTLEQTQQEYLAKLAEATQQFNNAPLTSGGDQGVSQKIAKSNMEHFKRELDIVNERIEHLQAKSPIDGVVVKPFDPQRDLGGKPVKAGEELMTVAQLDGVDGRWILEVKMPEDKMGHVLKAREARKAEHERLVAAGTRPPDSAADPLGVKFILANHPQKQFHGHILEYMSKAEFDKDLKENVVMIRVLPDDVLSVERNVDPTTGHVVNVRMSFRDGTELPLDPGAEVRAKVECGKRPMGYVVLRELIEFVYERIIF